jgi:hypothetical protein
MRYLLLIYGDEGAWGKLPPEAAAQEMQRWYDYTDWLRDKGWHRGGEALEPTPAATTVRVRDGKAMTTDGPFAETREQLGGYYLIECANLDEAIEAASRIPSVDSGSIEIRPIMETGGTPAEE